MPRILVALDGTPKREQILQTAVSLARQNGGQIAAVSVLEIPSDPFFQHLAQDTRDKALIQLEANLQSAADFARTQGVLLTPMLREGHPADAILACAEKHKSDVLVLGGGDSGIPSRPGLGATADHVSSHCQCSVLIVK